MKKKLSPQRECPKWCVWVERCDFCSTKTCTKKEGHCEISYKFLNRQKLCDKCFFIALDFLAGNK